MPAKESQTAMIIKEKELKLEPVRSETEIITNKKFATLQMNIKIKEENLTAIKEKIKKQKSLEKKHLVADEFIQKKMKLNSKMVLADGDYDQNWHSLKDKLFGDVL